MFTNLDDDIKNSYRIIRIDLNDRILKGYTGKDMSVQDDFWKEVTTIIWRNQHYLFDANYPVFDIGRLVKFGNLLLFEEFSKDFERVGSLDIKDSEKFLKRFLEKEQNDGTVICGNYLNSVISTQNDIVVYDNLIKRYCLFDSAKLKAVDKYENYSNLINFYKRGYKLRWFKLLENEKGHKIWRNLYLAENVRKKMVRLFRKDISLDQKDLLMSVTTTKSGDSKEN